MKKVFIPLCLLVLLASPALAANATRPGKIREEARIRIQSIRDEKKQQILEHISSQLTLINGRTTQAMLKHLEQIQALLNKIKVRMPAVDIAAAQTKINEAEAAVNAQAEKEYVIEFINESGLRVGASAAKTQFRADIKAVREKVRLARQAVVDVLKAAKAL